MGGDSTLQVKPCPSPLTKIKVFQPELTSAEEKEVERQAIEEAHFAFHSTRKCKAPLLLRGVRKKRDKKHFIYLKRLYCPTHHLYVDTSGWKIGMAYGEASKNFKNK